jgi:hypothetical protein
MPAYNRALMPRDELIRPAWFTGNVFACALRDRLVGRALAGDPAAVKALLPAIPQDLPPGARRGERDRAIRQVAADLRDAHPGLSGRGLARLLAAAGARVEAGHSTIGPGFGWLTGAETRALIDAIGTILLYAPAARDGTRWLSTRHLFRVCQD